MKNKLRLFVIASLTWLLLCPLARADFNPAIVASDAKWVAFLDVAELRGNALGKQLIESAQKNPKFGAGADGKVVIDFQKTLATIESITAYGANFSKDPKTFDGTLLIQGTAELRKIAVGIAAQATISTPNHVSELKDLPFEAYLIDGQTIVGFPPEPIVLVSKSKPQLLKALAVFRRTSPSLAQTPASPLADLLAKSGHSYVVAASLVPTEKIFPEDGPQTRILQMANSGMILLSEEDTRTVAHLQLAASSDEMADKLLKIVQGLVAVASLTESNDKYLAEFLQSATVERQNRIVTVHLSYATERLVQMIQNAQQTAKSASPAGAHSMPGKVVAEWKPGKAPAGVPPSAELLADHTIENVRLYNGSTITLIGRRAHNGAAMFDKVEISAQPGSATSLRFEAEGMKHRGFRIQNAPFASRGKLIALTGSFGSAQFEFPGEDGVYQIRVRYVEEAPGKTTLAVNVKDPDPTPEVKTLDPK